jgi:hypothetical protein
MTQPAREVLPPERIGTSELPQRGLGRARRKFPGLEQSRVGRKDRRKADRGNQDTPLVRRSQYPEQFFVERVRRPSAWKDRRGVRIAGVHFIDMQIGRYRYSRPRNDRTPFIGERPGADVAVCRQAMAREKAYSKSAILSYTYGNTVFIVSPSGPRGYDPRALYRSCRRGVATAPC